MDGGEDLELDILERELRMDEMRADIKLKNTQSAAEWPKVFTAIILAVAAIMATAGGFFGYSLRH